METILYVDASTESEAYRLKLSGINRYAQTRKWNVQTIYYSPHKEPPIAKLLAEIRPSGVIVESCEDRHHFDRRLFGRVPVVYLDANARLYGKNTPMVLHKPDEAADLAVREFQMLGCRHVAYVGWFGQVFWSAMREKAFVQAATVGGLTCDV